MAFAIFSCVTQAAEIEPNDTLATATNINSFLTSAEAVLGNGPEGLLDVDFYRFDTGQQWPHPILLTAYLRQQTPGALLLRLFNAGGTEIPSNDVRTGPEDDLLVLHAMLVRSGTYYLGVSTASNPLYDPYVSGSGRADLGGMYDLSLKLEYEPRSPSMLEPNDSLIDSTSMGMTSFSVVDEFIGDSPAYELDVDIYRLSLLTPARIQVFVAGGGCFDPAVRVRHCEDPLPTPYTMDHCLLGESDDEPEGSLGASVDTAVFEPGDVYIMVSGSGNWRYDPARPGSGEYGSVGAYDLFVTIDLLTPPTAGEPNDSIPTATQTPLLIEGRPVSLSMDGFLGDGPYATLRGDRDFYAVRSIDDPRVLSIDVLAGSIGSALIPVVVAFDDEGHVLRYADGSLTGNDAHLEVAARCVVNGHTSLNLLVLGTRQRLPDDPFDPFWYDGQRVGEHEIVDGPGSTGPYRLTVSTRKTEGDCETEPNDTAMTAQATGLVDGGLYVCTDLYLGNNDCPQAVAHGQGDLDLWSFRVEHAPASLHAETWRLRCDGYDQFNLALLDDAGHELKFVYGYGQQGGSTLTYALADAGTYYLAAGCFDTGTIRLFAPCTTYCHDQGPYQLAITLQSNLEGQASAGRVGADGDFPEKIHNADVATTTSGSNFFGTVLDPEEESIQELDQDGRVLSVLSPPEGPLGGLGGLATDGAYLYFIGSGRFPLLYQLDRTTGEVLAKSFTWFGSGYYSDATMLGDELYLLDHRRRVIHVLNPFGPRYLRSMALDGMPGITIGGGLAASPSPNRLYVADAFNTSSIYEIYPQTGALISILSELDMRPTALVGLNGELYVTDFTTLSISN